MPMSIMQAIYFITSAGEVVCMVLYIYISSICVTTGWALDWWTGGLDTYIYVYTLIPGESQEEYTYSRTTE